MNQKKEILEKLAFIRRHKEFASFGVKEQEVSYNPCLSEEDIKEFEHKHCITLPDDYRTFISEIGNGGFGPGYGLLPLDKAIVDFKLKDKPNISLNEKFPYQDSWNEEWITSFNWDEGYPEWKLFLRFRFLCENSSYHLIELLTNRTSFDSKHFLLSFFLR